MVMLPNDSGHRNEVIFMPYEEIIKTPYPVILAAIRDQFASTYENFLDLNRLRERDNDGLMVLTIQRSMVNIFEYLAKADFDFETSLAEFKGRFADIYKKSTMLKMAEVLPLVIAQKFTKKVYMYSPEYDPRIHTDIQSTIGSMDKITYITAPNIADAVMDIEEPINTFILNDVAQVVQIAETGKLKGADVMLASYGYNYTVVEDGGEDELALKINTDEMSKEYDFRLVTFPPKDLKESDFALM